MIKVGNKWMFPDDEDTAGGSYEHRKRMKEMQETGDLARQLTDEAMKKGAHHLADFLPKEELEKFTRKADIVKKGGDPTLEAPDDPHKDYKLGDTNKGFKLLKNAGWTEGQGLGAKASGIVTPLSG